MVALILSMFLISVTIILTGYHYRNDLEDRTEEINDSFSNEKVKVESEQPADKKPYYEKFVSSKNRNDFLDFSGGMLGI